MVPVKRASAGGRTILRMNSSGRDQISCTGRSACLVKTATCAAISESRLRPKLPPACIGISVTSSVEIPIAFAAAWRALSGAWLASHNVNRPLLYCAVALRVSMGA